MSAGRVVVVFNAVCVYVSVVFEECVVLGVSCRFVSMYSLCWWVLCVTRSSVEIVCFIHV